MSFFPYFVLPFSSTSTPHPLIRSYPLDYPQLTSITYMMVTQIFQYFVKYGIV